MRLCLKKYIQELSELLFKYNLIIQVTPPNKKIPGSFWGEEEAGLIKNTLYIRNDTPIHSALHEACHYICMDGKRREKLDTDAAGDYDEENGVCYLQILLSEQLSFTSIEEAMEDMDQWGYSFRLGSTKAWFEEDAEDAKQWLLDFALINHQSQPTYCLRS